jgi:ABC-type proline/glycine betaine transport system permease subunit
MENQYEYNPYEQPFEENKRPGFLTFLCVLTFIGSGFSLLTYLITPMFAQTFVDILRSSTAQIQPNVIEMYEQMAITPIWQFYMLALFCATSIMGAIYMLKMKKIGFHIYVISQLAQMAIGQFIIGGTYKPKWFGIFLTALFIGLYAIYYKSFTNLEDEQISES